MKKILALALVMIFAAGAFAATDPKDKILATVNGQNITEADIDRAMSMIDPQQRIAYDSPDGRQTVLDNLIDFKIFAQAGRDENLQNTEKFKETMAEIEERVFFSLATEKILDAAANPPVTDAEARKFYDEHKEIFEVPAAIRASHILIRADKSMPKKDQEAAQKKAANLIHDIETKKISFEDAARDNSGDGTRARGGDLGFFAKGQMVPEFEKAAFALKVGEMTSKPVKTDFGWHIIKVTDKRDASTRAFDEVKEDIKEDIVHQRQVEAIQKERDALREKYGVKIVEQKPEAASPEASEPAPAPKKK